MSDKRTGRKAKFERKVEKAARGLAELFQVFYDAKFAEGVSKRMLETYRENLRFLCDFLDMKQVPHDVTNVTTRSRFSVRKQWDSLVSVPALPIIIRWPNEEEGGHFKVNGFLVNQNVALAVLEGNLEVHIVDLSPDPSEYKCSMLELIQN